MQYILKCPLVNIKYLKNQHIASDLHFVTIFHLEQHKGDSGKERPPFNKKTTFSRTELRMGEHLPGLSEHKNKAKTNKIIGPV